MNFPRLQAAALALCTLCSLFACQIDDEPKLSSRGAQRGERDAAVADASRAAGGDAGRDAPLVLVGEVADSDVRLAAVIAADRARIFFCGGANSYATATHWLQADVTATGDIDFTDDRIQLQGLLDGRRLQGELTRDDEPAARFEARAVRSGTLAGLYEGEAACGRAGLIVTQSSSNATPTAQGACVGPGHLPQQVNPILPLTIDDDGTIAVEAPIDDEGGVEAVQLHAARPAS